MRQITAVIVESTDPVVIHKWLSRAAGGWLFYFRRGSESQLVAASDCPSSTEARGSCHEVKLLGWNNFGGYCLQSDQKEGATDKIKKGSSSSAKGV